jgi:hypothetical protein
MNDKLEHIVIKYLNKEYGDLEEFRMDLYPDSIFYFKDKKLYMEHALKNEEIVIDFDTMWADLRNIFGVNDVDIDNIIKKWVEETYNIRNVTPRLLSWANWRKVEGDYKSRKDISNPFF